MKEGNKIENGELNLHQKEVIFKTIIEHTPDITAIIDPHGKLVFLSPSVEHIYGYKNEESLGNKPTDFIHSDDIHIFNEKFQEAATHPGKSLYVPYFRALHKDGSLRWVEGLMTSSIDQSVFRGIVFHGRDVTERKRIEDLFKLQKELGLTLASTSDINSALQKLLEIILKIEDIDSGGIYFVDRTTGSCNLVVHHGLGKDLIEKAKYFSPDSKDSKRIRDGKSFFIRHDETAPAFLEARAKEGLLAVGSIPIIHNDQVIACLKVASHTCRNINQNVKDILDIIASQIGSIISRIWAEDQTKMSLLAKETLLREIHHRVKNNLQVIISMLNIQSQNITNQEAIDSFNDLQRRIYSMALIHEKLYKSQDLSQIELKPYINTLASYLFRSFRLEATPLTLECTDIHLNINKAIPLGIILNELVTNSLKYSMEQHSDFKLFIDCHIADDKLHVSVQDNGSGFPQDFRKKGSFGVKLVELLAKQLEGTVAFDSKDGALITLWFPVE